MNKKRLIIVLAAMALIAVTILVIAICSKPTPLPAYDAKNDPERATPTPDTTWGDFFSDADAGISLIVPKDFTHVIKGGYNTFVHKASTAYIQIKDAAYTPDILQVNEEYLRNSVAENGGAFGNYTQLSGTSYIFNYYLGEYEHEKRVEYDLDSIVVIEYCVPTEYIQVFNGMGEKVLNSVKYVPDNPIPNGVHLYYSEYGNFQYAIPDDWEVAVDGDVLYSADPVTGTEMMLTAFTDQITFEGYSQVDFVDNNNRQFPKYVCSLYYAAANELQAIGQYSDNGTAKVLIQYMMIRGEIVYQLFFTCPVSTYETASAAIEVLTSLFRVF